MTRSEFAAPVAASLSLFKRTHPAPPELAVAADCGRYFRNLRTRLDASRLQLARRVGCEVSVIAALERGDPTCLPSWPETVRIVTALTAPVGLNPTPGLRLVGRLWGDGAPDEAPEPTLKTADAPRFANIVQSAPAWRTAIPSPAPFLTSMSAEWSGALGRLRALRVSLTGSFVRVWSAWRILLALVALLAGALVVTRPVSLTAVTSAAVAPVIELVRAARGILGLEAPATEGGLRVITVDDPRSRRGDRLPIAKRAG